MKNILTLSLLFIASIGFAQEAKYIKFVCHNCTKITTPYGKNNYIKAKSFTGLEMRDVSTGETLAWFEGGEPKLEDTGTGIKINGKGSYSYYRIEGVNNYDDFVSLNMSCLKGASSVAEHEHTHLEFLDNLDNTVTFTDPDGMTVTLCKECPSFQALENAQGLDSLVISVPNGDGTFEDFISSDTNTFSEPETATVAGTDSFNNPYEAGATIITFPTGQTLCISKPSESEGDYYVGDTTLTNNPQPDGITVWHDVASYYTYHLDSNGELDSVLHEYKCYNFAPIANDDTDSTEINTPTTFTIISNNDEPVDSDIDETIIDFKFGTTGTEGGTFADNGDGTTTYTPPADTYGITDSVQYCIYDQEGDKSNIAWISVYIPCPEPVNATLNIADRGEAPNSTDNIDLILDASSLGFEPECFEICMTMRNPKTHAIMSEECITCDWNDPTNALSQDWYTTLGLSKPDGTALDATNIDFSGGIFSMVGVSKNDPDANVNLNGQVGWEHPNPDVNGYIEVDAKFMGCEDCSEEYTLKDTIHNSSWIELINPTPSDSNGACPNNSTSFNTRESPSYTNAAYCDDDDGVHMFIPNNGLQSTLYDVLCDPPSESTFRGCIDDHPCVLGMTQYCGDNQGVQDIMQFTATIHYANAVNGNALDLPHKWETYRDWSVRGHFSGIRFRTPIVDNEACEFTVTSEQRNTSTTTRCGGQKNTMMKVNGNIVWTTPDQPYCAPVSGGVINHFFSDEDIDYCVPNFFELITDVYVDTDNDGAESAGDSQFKGYVNGYVFKNYR